ncbi:hypothetical protein RV17_GL001095 [Enterococcus thailandicus]|nr:hypothetical protein RV17_GL001095 [Enterococcus thailandicus]
MISLNHENDSLIRERLKIDSLYQKKACLSQKTETFYQKRNYL